MISHKHKCIFIHIPKCAGQSIEKWFCGRVYTCWDDTNKIHVQHSTARQIKRLYYILYLIYYDISNTKWLAVKAQDSHGRPVRIRDITPGLLIKKATQTR